jgi:hypothetical protein
MQSERWPTWHDANCVVAAGTIYFFELRPRACTVRRTTPSRGTMATKLDKSIKRELEHQGKLYTITLAPDGVKVVEKGKRNGKELSWASIISGDAALNEDLKISVDATRSGM